MTSSRPDPDRAADRLNDFVAEKLNYVNGYTDWWWSLPGRLGAWIKRCVRQDER